MCTVTYLPIQNGFVLCSSRDEKPGRLANPPAVYPTDNKQFVYPQDVLSGGSWLAMSSEKRLVCLLNGAFENHTKQSPYRMSRGKVVLDSLLMDESSFLEDYRLDQIEPFTLLLLHFEEPLQFKTLVWDGSHKHIEIQDTSKPHIWSSATLYNAETRKLRTTWFEAWLQEHSAYEDRNIFDFHQTEHSPNSQINIKMKGIGLLETTSITKVVVTKPQAEWRFMDVIQNKSFDFVSRWP